MMNRALDPLILSLKDKNVLNETTGKKSVLFLNGLWHPAFTPLKTALTVYQPFKPSADAFLEQGVTCFPFWPQLQTQNALFDSVCLLLPKQKEETLGLLAMAYTALKRGGILFTAAENTGGGNRLEGWLQTLGAETIKSVVKNKARCTTAVRPANESPMVQTVLKEWEDKAESMSIRISDACTLETMPGLFSWNHIDEGSRLLHEHLPSTLTGEGADFGCGTGYLSVCAALANKETIRSLTLVDADARAVACATKNVQAIAPTLTVHSLWHDLRKPITPAPIFDFILMNPPFHEGQTRDTPLGVAFVSCAARHLRKGGTLFMVANRKLPYESVLRDSFSYVRLMFEGNGYKIYSAIL